MGATPFRENSIFASMNKENDIYQPDEEDVQAIKEQIESSTLEETLVRLDHLINDQKEVQPHMVGLKLAVIMGHELKTGLPLGSESGKEIQKWAEKFTSKEIDEAVAYAKQFLTNPEALAETLSKKLFGADDAK